MKKTSHLIHPTHILGQTPILCPNPYLSPVHMCTTLRQCALSASPSKRVWGCSWAMMLEEAAFSPSSGDDSLHPAVSVPQTLFKHETSMPSGWRSKLFSAHWICLCSPEQHSRFGVMRPSSHRASELFDTLWACEVSQRLNGSVGGKPRMVLSPPLHRWMIL